MSIVPYVSEPPAFTADWLLDPAEIAERIGGTDFVPRGLRGNPAAITAALLYGQEVGLGRMASLASIAVIDGKPSLSAESQRALILAAGHEVWFDESTTTRCIAAGRRKGSTQITRVTWTMDDAQRAGLAGKNNWRTYPRAMLQARASAELARAIFPDVIRGLLATEELDGDGTPAPTDAPPPEQPTTTRRRRRKAEAPPQEPTAPDPVSPDTRGGGAGGEAVRPVQETAGAGLGEEAPAPGDAQPSDEGGVVAAAPPSEEGPLLASDKQLRMIWAYMREVGLGEEDQRDLRLAYCSRVIDRPLESSAHLTMDEATSVIHDLQEVAEMPPEWRERRLLPENEAEVLAVLQDELGATEVVNDPGTES